MNEHPHSVKSVFLLRSKMGCVMCTCVYMTCMRVQHDEAPPQSRGHWGGPSIVLSWRGLLLNVWLGLVAVHFFGKPLAGSDSGPIIERTL